MRRLLTVVGFLVVLAAGAVLAHCAAIESAGEVAVVRTREPDGSWYEARIWIVDHDGHAWLHGADSRWMRNLKTRPEVEVVREGRPARHRATPVPGPHPAIHERLREKYGIADRWVRFLGPDDEATLVVRLDPIAER